MLRTAAAQQHPRLCRTPRSGHVAMSLLEVTRRSNSPAIRPAAQGSNTYPTPLTVRIHLGCSLSSSSRAARAGRVRSRWRGPAIPAVNATRARGAPRGKRRGRGRGGEEREQVVLLRAQLDQLAPLVHLATRKIEGELTEGDPGTAVVVGSPQHRPHTRRELRGENGFTT